MEIKATTGLIRPVGQVGQKPRNQRRQAAQHTPNQRRKALHKPPAGGATHHYPGRRKATQSQPTPLHQAAAISRSYPGILQVRSEGSVRPYSTRAANAARSAGASEIAAAGRFLLTGMIFFTKNERLYWNNAILELYYIIDNIFRSF